MAEKPPRDPSWVALAAAQTTLLVWLAMLFVADAGGAQAGPVVARAATAAGAAVFGILGFAVPAVLGMFPRLAPGLLGLPRAPRPLAAASSSIGAAMAVAALAWVATGEFVFVGVQGALGATGGVVLALTLLRLRRARTSDVPIAAPSAQVALPANLLMAAGLVHLVTGGASLAAVAFAPSAVAAAGLVPSLAWPLHLMTAGFVAPSVFSIGCRMFAAFSGVKAPPLPVWAIAVPAVVAPLGIAAGLASQNFGWVALFGTVALAASSTFSGLVLWMYRHQRRPRAAWQLLVAGALSLVAGEAVGALFGADPSLLRYAALHAQVNVLGFTGLTIFGVLFLLSGGEAARPGAAPPGVLIALLWPAALGLRAVAVVAELPPAALLADAVLLGGYLAAARTSHGRRRQKVAPAQEAV